MSRLLLCSLILSGFAALSPAVPALAEPISGIGTSSITNQISTVSTSDQQITVIDSSDVTLDTTVDTQVDTDVQVSVSDLLPITLVPCDPIVILDPGTGSTCDPSPVVTPEPATFALLGTGLLGLTGVLRRRVTR